jgi:hypothetical protein
MKRLPRSVRPGRLGSAQRYRDEVTGVREVKETFLKRRDGGKEAEGVYLINIGPNAGHMLSDY